MEKFAVTAGLLCIAASACADTADTVRCSEIAFSHSAEQQDAAAFASFIDDDARFVGGSVMRGPAEIAEAWSVFFADDGPTITWCPPFVEVLEDGTLALTRGPYKMVTTDEQGTETEHWGTFNSIWRRQADGSWKIVFDAGNDAARPPSDEVKAILEQDDACEE
jgi:uncharacterized protein (TIGR02246 family)